MVAGSRSISRLITRPDHHANLFDAGGDRLFDDQLQRRLVITVTINQLLQRQTILIGCGRGYHGLANLHRSHGGIDLEYEAWVRLA